VLEKGERNLFKGNERVDELEEERRREMGRSVVAANAVAEIS